MDQSKRHRLPEGTKIAREVANRVDAELPLLADHLRIWLEAHRAPPRAITASSDPDGTGTVEVWLVTDHIGDNDASSKVVYDTRLKTFGLVMELQNGRIWYMGPYGSLVDTVGNI